MAARHGGARRADRQRGRGPRAGVRGVRRVRPSGGHHRRLRAGAVARAPDLGRGGPADPPAAARCAAARFDHPGADRGQRGAVGLHEQRGGADADHAGGAAGGAAARPAAGTHADADRLRLAARRPDHADRDAAEPDRVGLPARPDRRRVRHVRLHPRGPHRGGDRRRLHRARRLAAGTGSTPRRRRGLRGRRLPHRGPDPRGHQGRRHVRPRGRGGGGRTARPGDRPRAPRGAVARAAADFELRAGRHPDPGGRTRGSLERAGDARDRAGGRGADRRREGGSGGAVLAGDRVPSRRASRRTAT